MDRLKQRWEELTRYLKEVRGEVRKVIWPDRMQTIRLTSVVVILSIVVGLIIGAADFVISRVFAVLLNS